MALSPEARSARREFVARYGTTTRDVVDRLVRGWSTDRISNALGVSPGTVAAYRANLARGSYAPFVYEDGFGSCSF